jgi:hypothetical protein
MSFVWSMQKYSSSGSPAQLFEFPGTRNDPFFVLNRLFLLRISDSPWDAANPGSHRCVKREPGDEIIHYAAGWRQSVSLCCPIACALLAGSVSSNQTAADCAATDDCDRIAQALVRSIT